MSNANTNNFDVIIIGGSYSGLSAAMALGRSLRKVLIIDGGKPCNRQTPHSHNFITHDGEKPAAIAAKAKEQVLTYSTVKFIEGLAISGTKTNGGFAITTDTGEVYSCRKLIFATGVKDLFPDIAGFSECWGISVIHCPYCHGYEARDEVTGILANGDAAMHLAQLVNNLTKKLTVYTNDEASFTLEQKEKLERNSIPVVETAIERIDHKDGHIERIVFSDGNVTPVSALYARVPFVQHSDIPQSLGCNLTEMGLIEVNAFQQTNVEGVYACGDNAAMMRSVANAVYTGNLTGAMVNKELTDAEF